VNTTTLVVAPDIGGLLHVIMSPDNPLHATLEPAPMIADHDGNLVQVDLHVARKLRPNWGVVSYQPKDKTSIVTPLYPGHGWYEPTLFQQRLIHTAITRAMSTPCPKNEGIEL